MDNTETFGPNLKRLIKRQGFKTYEQAAEAFDISLGYLNQLFRGERQPSREVLLKMSQIMKISVDELLGVKTEGPRSADRDELLTKGVILLASLNDSQLRRAVSVLETLRSMSDFDTSTLATDIQADILGNVKNKKR